MPTRKQIDPQQVRLVAPMLRDLGEAMPEDFKEVLSRVAKEAGGSEQEIVLRTADVLDYATSLAAVHAVMLHGGKAGSPEAIKDGWEAAETAVRTRGFRPLTDTEKELHARWMRMAAADGRPGRPLT